MLQHSTLGPSGIERVVKFKCGDDTLIGICNMTEQKPSVGVLVIVGGRQYRVGSHRQFVVLARQLAASGVAVMRFDLRGMGDSQGDPRDFNSLQEDINAAGDCFRATIPSLKNCVLWGLCDGATAAIQCATECNKYSGVVMVNPWISDEISMATYVKHYYSSRLKSIDFWKKMLAGKIDIPKIFSSINFSFYKKENTEKHENTELEKRRIGEDVMALLSDYKGEVSIIISKSDTTAQEFVQLLKSQAGVNRHLEGILNNLEYVDADHTFSTSDAKKNIGVVSLNCITKIVRAR